MSKIELLVIDNFRGASVPVEIEFDNKKAMVLIFGENGSGKTTIVDALDAVGNLSKGSLEDRSSTKARNHLPTIGKKPEDVRIELRTGRQTWIAKLRGSKIDVQPDTLPRISILRRSKLLKLIEARPADRYDALKRFIEVEKIEAAEQQLNFALKAVNKEIAEQVVVRSEAEESLKQIWEMQGSPGENAGSWADSLTGMDISEKVAAIASLKTAHQSVGTAVRARDAHLKVASTFSEKKAAYEKVQKEVMMLSSLEAEKTIKLVGVLSKVNAFLKTGSHSDACPVCRQEIKFETLKQDVMKRLDELKSFDSLRKKRKGAEEDLILANESFEQKEQEVYDAILALNNEKGLIEFVSPLNNFANQEEARSTLKVDAVLERINLFEKKEHEIAEKENALTKETGLVDSLRVIQNNISKNKASTEQLIRLAEVLESAHKVMLNARINFTQNVLDEIAGECNRLYGIIHPNEPLGLSKIELDRAKRASVIQKSFFEGHDGVPPQAYFSESHLDTLGFCLWLAMAKRENKARNAMLVLDDVFTSVDSQHINRIAQLIIDESEHFAHIIVTTHQRLWRDFYRYHKGPGKKADMIELQGWSMSRGISSYQTRVAVRDLADTVQAMPFDRQVTAQKAGILLEAILDHLALQYHCRVARTHDNSNTLGQLLDGTNSLFKKLEVHHPIKDQHGEVLEPPQYSTASVKTVIGQLSSLVFIRNQVGAHFNVHGTGISDVDIKQFGSITVALAQALSCNICGQLPGKAAGTHFKCSCKAPNELRMTPLQL